MGRLSSQLEFIENMLVSLRELVRSPVDRPADPLVEAFEAETIEKLFYSDGTAWASRQLFDASRLLTIASYHRIALSEISRTLAPYEPLTVARDASTDWTTSDVLDFSGLETNAADVAQDDPETGADDDAGERPMVSGELLASINTNLGYSSPDRGARISLLPIVAIPLLLLTRPLEAQVIDAQAVLETSEQAAIVAPGVDHAPKPEAATTDTMPSDASSADDSETSSSSEGVDGVAGGAAGDELSVAEQPMATHQASVSAHHSSTPVVLFVPATSMSTAASEPTGAGSEKFGTSGDDILTGTDGTDIIRAGAGNDVLVGSQGADVLDGGAGIDTASYAASSEAVSVDLSLGGPQQSSGDASGDVLVSIENVTGSAYDDSLTGNAGSNVLEGGQGADHIDGGAGVDTASYATSSEAVSVDLSLGGPQQSSGDASGDVLVSVENVTGSAHDDSLTGNAGSNVLEGGQGADVLDGGAGIDTASYAASSEAVSVDLSLGGPQQSTGDASGDVLVSIENVTGSAYDDSLTGNAGSNVLEGGQGADHIDGGAGVDTASYATSSEAVSVDLSLGGPQQSSGDASGDVLVSVENVTGSAHDDTLAGGDGANSLAGGDGNDTYIVTDSLDFVFEESMSGIDVVKAAISYFALTDNVENVVYTGAESATLVGNELANFMLGGSLSDIILGEAGDDTLSGAGGDDVISGGCGDDSITGGDGNDLISGGSGSNSLEGGAGNDWLITFEGSDTLVLRPGFGNDTVEGFGGHGQGGSVFDEIDISAYGFNEDSLGLDIMIYAMGDDAVIRIGSDTLTLLDTRVKDIGKSDFIFT